MAKTNRIAIQVQEIVGYKERKKTGKYMCLENVGKRGNILSFLGSFVSYFSLLFYLDQILHKNYHFLFWQLNFYTIYLHKLFLIKETETFSLGRNLQKLNV